MLTHWHEQRTARVWMERVCSFEEVEPINPGQLEIRRDQRDLGTLLSQSLQHGESGLRRVGRQQSVVSSEASDQSRLGRGARLLVGVHDHDHGGSRRGPIRGWCSLRHDPVRSKQPQVMELRTPMIDLEVRLSQRTTS
ncbi:MAG: hypothetical protein M3336_00935 [Chloroflexota bacterium]|nr:hypothetical protein [Chloroflexota bacterium]